VAREGESDSSLLLASPAFAIAAAAKALPPCREGSELACAQQQLQINISQTSGHRVADSHLSHCWQPQNAHLLLSYSLEAMQQQVAQDHATTLTDGAYDNRSSAARGPLPFLALPFRLAAGMLNVRASSPAGEGEAKPTPLPPPTDPAESSWLAASDAAGAMPEIK
jgi:hypothetical protein